MEDPQVAAPATQFWAKFSLIYAAGVFAAASIGKIGPISGDLRSDLGLSLDQVGLVASSVTATAAVVGVLVGLGSRRLAQKPLLLVGLAIMAVAGALVSRMSDFGPLVAARLAESVGYVIVVVAAPVLVMSLGEGRRRTAALAVWGTFLPIGLALGSFAGGIVASAFGWRVWLGAAAAAIACVAVVVAIAVPRREVTTPESVGSGGHDRFTLRGFARPVALSAGFATASAAIVATVTMFPSFLQEVFDVPAAQAGTLTGAVSLVGVSGGFAAGWLLHRGKPVSQLFIAGVLVPLGATFAFLELGGVSMSLAGALVVAVTNELVVAAVFAAVPMVVRSTADISTTNGLVAQLGSLGTLAGPPLIGLVVIQAGGWWAVGPALAVPCLVGVVLLRTSVRPSSTV
ncbi:CynX/NimT family MFS transporter [Nocardiopsis gilva]|uniref:MFS transporter n=1 Tax=Nocardiopsis gilva TaxID=280236 RepID=UPI0012FE2B96|nr:MFS transporter [Nocardiopsis gilva]